MNEKELFKLELMKYINEILSLNLNLQLDISDIEDILEFIQNKEMILRYIKLNSNVQE